jgi:hypothetical protein
VVRARSEAECEEFADVGRGVTMERSGSREACRWGRAASVEQSGMRGIVYAGRGEAECEESADV